MSKRYQDGFSVIEAGIIIVVIAVIGLLGWKFYDAKFNSSAVNSIAEKNSTADMVPEQLSDLADLTEIQQSAIADKSGVTVVHLELEQSGETLVYKAELSDGTVAVYNARTGARLSTKTVTEKTSESLPTNIATGIGFAKALEIAKAEKPSSKVYKIELELEGGVVVYSVRFTDKARVDVNAQTGAIVRTKAAKVDTNNSKAAESAAKPAPSAGSSSSKSSSSNSSSSSSSNSGSDDSSHRSGSDDSHHSDDSRHGDDDHDDLSDNDDDDDDDDRDDDRDDDDNSGSGSDDSDNRRR